MQTLATYILRGRIQAAGIIGLFGTLGWIFPFSFLFIFSCAAVGLVVLNKGAREGLLALIGATIFCMLVAYVRLGTPTLVIMNVVVMWLPVWLCAQILRRTRSQTMVLIIVMIMSLLLAFVLRSFTENIEALWHDSLTKYASKIALIANAENQAELIKALAVIMNGFIAASFGLMIMISLLLARWWQSLLINPGGFGEEFRKIRLPWQITVPILISAIMVAVVKVPVPPYGLLLDLLMVGTAMLMFHGLAIVHFFVRERQLGNGWLAGLYFFLVVAAVYVFSMLAMLAILDSFSNYRKLGSKAA